MTESRTTDDATETPVADLLEVVVPRRVTGDGPEDRFTVEAPDWFGERVFGGVVVAQGLVAAAQTVDAPMRVHSLHAYFLGALRPGPVEIEVDRLRDGRSFTTRHARSRQDDRTALWCTVSFHPDEPGPEYQLAMPEVPAPETLEAVADDEGPLFDIRPVGPTPRRPDGTYRSTRRYWVRTAGAMPEDPLAHLGVAAYLSDMTGASFRPHNLDEWGTHTDASIDHAVWFHRPLRTDEWVYVDLHALVNGNGRSTMRGEFYDRDGNLCLSMAQELLIRPL